MTATVPILSVVVAAFNEARDIGKILGDLRALRVSHEVFVVDGGSTDATAQVARALGARVVECQRERGRQLGAGAHAARGAWLWFVHADVRLPAASLRAVEAHIQHGRRAALALRLSIDRRGWGYRLIEAGAWLRSRWAQLPYGDQSLLVTRQMYEAAGGFCDVPLLEDVLLVHALRRHTVVRTSTQPVRVSARRWQRDGVLMRTLANTSIMFAYSAGVDPADLATLYQNYEPGHGHRRRLLAGSWRLLRAAGEYYASIPSVWGRQVVHNGWGILNVLDLIAWRPMPGGRLTLEHPFCTGKDSHTGQIIWHQNVIFRTARHAGITDGEVSDEVIVHQLGTHLSNMVKQAAHRDGAPEGLKSRMPAAINYLHGAVHYNGGWLIFNDYAEAIRHFTCPAFVAELKRFVHTERREPLLVFRRAGSSARSSENEYADFVCCLRTLLPWFSNSNGPTRPVLWGNPAPWPVVNIITGHWIADVRMLKTDAGVAQVPRPPIACGKYFQDNTYVGSRERVTWVEHALAVATAHRVRLRGARENLFFVDKRQLKNGARYVGHRLGWPTRAADPEA